MIISQRFFHQANHHAHKTAIIYRQQRLTYAEVANHVILLSELLHDMGVRRGSRIGLFLHNSPLFTIAMLATAELGALIAPLPVAMGESGLRSAIHRLKLTHALGEQCALEEMSRHEGAPPQKNQLSSEMIWGQINQKSLAPLSRVRAKKEVDLPWVLTMTSGSTGDPKPIILSQKCKLHRAIEGAQRLYDLSDRDVILTASPMYHSLGMRLALLPLLIGATSVILHKFAPKPWLQAVEQERITFSIPVSHQLVRLLPFAHEYDLDSLRCLVSSSAKLTVVEKEACLDVFKCQLHECYGTSEVGIVTSLSLSNQPYATDSVGKALHHVELRIIDDNGNPCKTGEIGEITCRTLTAFSGYDNQPDATTESVVGGFFRTGDIGYLDEQGFLYLKGRKKEIIKVGGVSVYPQDIEKVVSDFPGVRECAVVGIPNQLMGEEIAVALTVENADGFNIEKIRRYCIIQLADYQQPQRWFILDSLPKTELGKLQRTRLADRLQGELP